ncbi:MAG: von Willebrand factor type A domain-containing protein, partial [Lachnospiraceae bacterium]|nr:von Willebrand factor type A domain-containing protein [Lachnospiraceae bacterium]
MKKRVIALVLGLCIFTLSACGAVAENDNAYSKVETRSGETREADLDEVLPDYAQVPDDWEPSEEEVSLSAIKESIAEAGMAYDGIVSRENPSIDSILLENDIMTLAESDFDCNGRGEKAAVEEYMDLVAKFRSYFKEIKVYEPRDGYTIAISAKKLYEYKIEDTGEILAIYDDIQKAQSDLPYRIMDDEVSYGSQKSSKSLFRGITSFIAPETNKAAATEECEVAEDYCCEAEACDEADLAGAVPSEEAILPDVMPDVESWQAPEWNTEEYKSFEENRFMSAQSSPFSTFGMDVDTASYANFRKKIFNGRDIPKDSVRAEEMINSFDYDYAKPAEGEKFGVTTEIADTPWNPDTKLLRVGVKSEEADTEDVASNVVFLIDTSGSMFDADKLPLVQKSFLMLLHSLDKNDKVSIVTYAGSDEIKCEGISCDKKEKVTQEILSLEAWGGTNGAAGITTAYELAKENFIDGGNNRVILATDGDLNLGLTSESDLVDLIKEEKESGVFLSVLGVGSGNYKDSKMKALADNGNGNFAYIDSTTSASKALIRDFNSLMYTVAKDAKMQVEFNPAKIKG